MKRFAAGLILGLVISCTSMIAGQLRFQDRELIIHPDKPGLGFPWHERVCVQRTGIGRVLGKKCHEEIHDDFYDMNDKVVRKSLIDAGFSCTSKMRFKY